MNFRKIFSIRSESVLHHRHEPSFVENRGVYPEPRSNQSGSKQSRVTDPYPEPGAEQMFAMDHDPIHVAERQRFADEYSVAKRRMPLTTLNALLQIKANKQGDSSAPA